LFSHPKAKKDSQNFSGIDRQEFALEDESIACRYPRDSDSADGWM